jgi:hypothetical protein
VSEQGPNKLQEGVPEGKKKKKMMMMKNRKKKEQGVVHLPRKVKTMKWRKTTTTMTKKKTRTMKEVSRKSERT